MKILIVAAGSLGDTLPFVALGKALQARGHRVVLFGGPLYADHAAGLEFRPVGSPEAARALLAHPDITHPRAGWQVIGGEFIRLMPELYEDLRAHAEPGRTLAIGSTFAFPVRLLGETLGVPTVTAHLAPAPFRSRVRAPRMALRGRLDALPAAWQSGVWRLVDRLVLEPLFTRPFNEYRASLGLPPVERACDDWLHRADLVLGMFPAWFATVQPDWPPVALAGFPLFDQGATQGLSPELQAFLDAGTPPIGFTTGTANAVSHRFFEAATRACVALGRRGLLITHTASQLPASLPPGVMHVDYAPFSRLLPRLAAFVHHGGIGTTSQALRAGVPQLVRPMGYDQFDNASYVRELGAGRVVSDGAGAWRLARALRRVLEDPAMRASCARVAEMAARDGDASAIACEAIEALGARSGLAA